MLLPKFPLKMRLNTPLPCSSSSLSCRHIRIMSSRLPFSSLPSSTQNWSSTVEGRFEPSRDANSSISAWFSLSTSWSLQFWSMSMECGLIWNIACGGLHLWDNNIVLYFAVDKLLRENYNQYFLLGICPSRLFRTFNEANILLIVYFDNMFDLQSQKLQLESV